MEHFLTRAMNKGNCRKLIGNMVFFLTFVSDPEYVWSDEKISRAYDICVSSIKFMKEAAKEDHVPLGCYVHKQKVTIGCRLSVKNNNEWRKEIARNLGAADMEALHEALRKKYGMDTIVYVFMTGKAGRAYALPVYTNSNQSEGVVLFRDFDSILHEVFHLFGAADYYYPERLAQIAKRYFPDSVMLVGGGKDIDDVTRYLIGWHSQPTAKALAFLRETSVISAQEADEALKRQWGTSSGKQKVRFARSLYEGEMKEGMMHGQGILTYDDGHRYVGEFRNGTFDGWGRMTYPDGKVYEGEYKEGAMHGQGTFMDKLGKVLMKGRFENNKFIG